ncbi:MAG: hypothetical protein HN909_09730, partial [Phycisphaerales bacterium]|nr:hypothetical protein [Phycisphaerales bacterium]
MMFEQGTRIRVLALVSLGMLALVPAGVFASATSDASHVVTLPSLAPATITGEYHVTLNGTSSRDLLSDKGTAIYSSDGNIEVRPEMYDTAFSNARQIKIAVWKGNEPFWPSYKTMANGVDSYIYRFRMDKDKTYGMKIQIVTRDGKTVTPKNFPREFTWKTTATPATKPIGQIQPGMAKNVLISKADDLVSFRGVYGQPMELRFVRGNATELQFLHTGRRAPYSSLRTYRNYIALNGRWTETSSYAKNTAASKRVKFSASDKTSKDKVLVCDFKVTVPRGERYTVQTKQGDKWVLLAYLSNRTAPPVIVLPERPTPPTTPAPATRPKTITIERPGGTITISGPKALPRDYRIVADGSSAVAFEWRYTGNFSYGGLRTYATYIHHGSSYYAPSTYQRSSHVSKNFVLGSQSESPSGTVRWTLAVTLPSNSSYGLYKQDRAKGAWVLQARIVTPAATRPTRPTGHGGRRRMTLEEVGRLNQAYNNAYRRALALIAQGRSNTPEARKAHQDYLVAKAAYEQANTAYQAMQLRSITNPGSGSSRPHRPHRPRRITQADVDLAHQKHTAAYAEAMRLYHAGRAGTPEGKAAYAEHDRTRKVYLDTKAAFEKQPPVPTTTKPGTVIVTPVPTTPTRPPTKAELDWLYQEYLDARNKASILIDAEKGSTAEGREAYKNYEAAKDTYLKAKAAYDKAQTSTPAAASTVPTQAEVDKLYQEYIAAHNKLTYLM